MKTPGLRLPLSLGRKALLASLILTAASAFGASPEWWRDAYIRWRGGDAFRALQRRHFSGEIHVSTLSGTFEAWEDCAGRFRFDGHAGAVEVSTRIDGTTGFSLTPGGQVEPLSPVDCESQVLSILVVYAGVLEGDRQSVISSLPVPSGSGDTEAPPGFRWVFPNGDTYDFHLDPQGALLALDKWADGRGLHTTYGNWRAVDGVRLPRSIESVSSADGQRTQLQIIEEQLNPSFDPAVFAKPEVASRIAFQGSARDSGRIPFDFFAGNRLFLPGTISGKPATLLLDSGAEITVLDAAFAAAAGITPTGHMDIRGTGGTTNSAIASHVVVAIGTMTLHTGTVLLMDLGEIARTIDHPLQAILGKEALNESVTDVDFDAGTIVFRDPATFIAPKGMTRVPLTVANGIRSVPFNLEGHGASNAEFDLGNGKPLILFPAAVEKWRLLEGRPVAHRIGGGVGGQHEENVFVVRSVEIGGFTLREVPVASPVSAEGLASATGESVLGNLGMPVWSRFHLVMDFSRNQLFLSAPSHALDRPFAKNRSGMTVMRDGDALKVLLVDPSFPGSVCDTGAEIVAIDGLAVAQIRSTTEWTERSGGTKVRLTFRDGHTAELTLADYF